MDKCMPPVSMVGMEVGGKGVFRGPKFPPLPLYRKARTASDRHTIWPNGIELKFNFQLVSQERKESSELPAQTVELQMGCKLWPQAILTQ
ncbi:MAG: hypothetical protein CM1200mP29_10300 [Verrucomicrobiota bacterium]|nr:MAG: hypothetical protein CM1200mP29_10300 [Verrucomicrobiota bacterium]